MRKFSPWYLLFMAALNVGSVIWLQDFSGVLMLMSFWVGDLLCLRLDKTQQGQWFIPYALVIALVFGLLYYAADLALNFAFFPHSDRSAHRLKSAIIDGALGSFLILLASRSMTTKKRDPISATN